MSEPTDTGPGLPAGAGAPGAVAPEAAASEEGAAAPEAGAAAEGIAPPEGGVLQRRLELVAAQLEDSMARARETGARLKDEHERLLRTAAEFENFKKRAAREKEDLLKFGGERMLKEFLPIADNLERALDHAEQHDPKVVLEGVKLVQKMLDQAFGKHGLASFSAVGKPFDPNQHEALMQVESDLPPGTVVSEMARGYRLHERLLRPAAVVVARARAAQAEAPPAGEAAGEAANGSSGEPLS